MDAEKLKNALESVFREMDIKDRVTIQDDWDGVHKAVVIGDGEYVAYPGKDEVPTIAGDQEVDCWIVDKSRLVINYPGAPDDVDFMEVGRYGNHWVVAEAIALELLREKIHAHTEHASWAEDRSARETYCEDCGQSWVVHNDDGSCVED